MLHQAVSDVTLLMSVRCNGDYALCKVNNIAIYIISLSVLHVICCIASYCKVTNIANCIIEGEIHYEV